MRSEATKRSVAGSEVLYKSRTLPFAISCGCSMMFGNFTFRRLGVGVKKDKSLTIKLAQLLIIPLSTRTM